MSVKTNIYVSANLAAFMADSKTADRRVEEDAAREVGIAPLGEGSLLFEILLDC